MCSGGGLVLANPKDWHFTWENQSHCIQVLLWAIFINQFTTCKFGLEKSIKKDRKLWTKKINLQHNFGLWICSKCHFEIVIKYKRFMKPNLLWPAQIQILFQKLTTQNFIRNTLVVVVSFGSRKRKDWHFTWES